MKKMKFFLLLHIIILLIYFCSFTTCSFANVNSNNSDIDINNPIKISEQAETQNSGETKSQSNTTNQAQSQNVNNNADKISTYSPSCILIESSTGKILYEKNSHEVRYPASTTKIMTAILTIENCKLSDVATVSHNAIFSVPASYAHANLREGEQLTIEQLLNVLLIPSANDSANVLAEHVAGSIDKFADMMNKKAKEIGCLNTHFVNPNGVHKKNHTTTAYDLALIGRYCMQNNTFREFVKKTECSLPQTNKYNKDNRKFKTTNDLLKENNSKAKNNYYYPYAIGIKTGYTSEAGSCIVAGAKKDGLEVIAVILGGENTEEKLSGRYLDCINLFNYAFENYSMKTLNEKNSVVKQISVFGATSETKNLNVLVKDKISALVNQKQYLPTPEITINDNLRAPISANSIIGKITYKIDGEVYSSDLIAESNVDATNFFSILIYAILIFITLFFIYLLIKKPKSRKPRYASPKHSKSKGNFRFTTLNNFYNKLN